MIRSACIILLLVLIENTASSQCCASSGNPIGGTVNIGLLDKHVFRTASFYRFSFSDKYHEGGKLYSGEMGSIEKAVYNYIGLLSGYGVSEKLTIEVETGYYINKTHVFKINGERLTGYGLSDAVISFRPRIYHNSNSQLEISCAIGSNIPFSRNLQQVNGVTLPVDLQTSTGSFGMVIQSNIIKENSFRSVSYLLINRFEKYFENKQEYTYGNSYSTSFFFSKYFSADGHHLNGLTLILQLKNQIREKNMRAGQKIDASGNCSFFLIPQINFSISGNWNISMLVDIPVYQFLNEIQLANRISSSISLVKDVAL
jgi:hypothetical protein